MVPFSDLSAVPIAAACPSPPILGSSWPTSGALPSHLASLDSRPIWEGESFEEAPPT